MKRALALVLCILSVPALAGASERILSYDSRIEVRRDSSMAVTETIKVNAEGARIKRGIYRDFPTVYTGGYTVGFSVKSVKRDGAPEPYHLQGMSNGIRVYMGKSDVYIPYGEHTYELTYETDRQLGYFDDHDELYWNVTGNGWMFPIDRATATVILPEGVPEGGIRMDGFTGPRGSKARDLNAMLTHGRPYFITNDVLRPYEGLTIVVGWPKGFVDKPAAGAGSRPEETGTAPPVESAGKQDVMRFLMPTAGKAVFGQMLVALLAVYYIFVWARVGRDPEKGVIVPLFVPPKGVSPAACRYISRMAFDDKAFAAAIVNAAVKGCVTINEKVRGMFEVKRAKGDLSALNPDERKAVEILLRRSDLIELKQEHHTTIRAAVDSLKDSLKESYEKVYFFTNTQYFVPGAVVSFFILVVTAFLTSPRMKADSIAVLAFMSVWLSGWTVGVIALLMTAGAKWKSVFTRGGKLPALGEAVFLTLFSAPFIFFEIFGLVIFTGASSLLMPLVLFEIVLVNILFYHLLKARTLAGRTVMDAIEGFRMYLATAEKDEIRAMGAPSPTPQLFEKYLPYAIALDVENAWADKFADVLSRSGMEDSGYSPVWYSGSSFGRSNFAGFASAMGSSLPGTISSSSTAPGSSSGFGGGGGGGGGGSGGGGGGGGGGGW